MPKDGKINYVELPGSDLPATKGFYEAAFGWSFTDYGPDYAAFQNAGLDGGFHAQPDGEGASTKPLVILYAKDLEAMQAKVEASGGRITQAIFPFPGGRRFHFEDPSGNELAVWSDGGV
jgi:predicted enzyme related to lactoylglutathione lyase